MHPTVGFHPKGYIHHQWRDFGYDKYCLWAKLANQPHKQKKTKKPKEQQHANTQHAWQEQHVQQQHHLQPQQHPSPRSIPSSNSMPSSSSSMPSTKNQQVSSRVPSQMEDKHDHPQHLSAKGSLSSHNTLHLVAILTHHLSYLHWHNHSKWLCKRIYHWQSLSTIWQIFINNISRSVRIRWKPSRQSPVWLDSWTLLAVSPSMMERTNLHELNGSSMSRKAVSRQVKLPICTHPEGHPWHSWSHQVTRWWHDTWSNHWGNHLLFLWNTQHCSCLEPSCMKQQPGDNLCIYINKWKELHWWCTKKLPKAWKLQDDSVIFLLLLQDPNGRKLCVNLWDEQDQQKVLMLQLCFNEAINSCKKYQVNKHRRNLEIIENSIEINKTSCQKPNFTSNKNYNKNYNQGGPNHNYKNTYNKGINTKLKCKFCFGPTEVYYIHKLLNEHASSCTNQVRMVESTANFIKERTGNAAQIDETELEALAEMYNHPIEHVIQEINMYDFPELEDHQSCMRLDNLKQGMILTSIIKTLALTLRYMRSTQQPLVMTQEPPSLSPSMDAWLKCYWTLVQKGVIWT